MRDLLLLGLGAVGLVFIVLSVMLVLSLLSQEREPGLRIGGLHITKGEGRLLTRHTRLVLGLSAALVVVHEILYRTIYYAEGEYPFLGIVSHAGSDLIIMGSILSLAVWAVQEKA